MILATTIYLPGCAPSSITDEFQDEQPRDVNEVNYEEPPACPVSISGMQGYYNPDSTVRVSYTIGNLTDERIMSVKVRTHITNDYLMENPGATARESAHSDTTIQCSYFKRGNAQSVEYTPSGIPKNSGKCFFFEVVEVKFYEDSLVTGRGWYHYDGEVTLGGQQ